MKTHCANSNIKSMLHNKLLLSQHPSEGQTPVDHFGTQVLEILLYRGGPFIVPCPPGAITMSSHLQSTFQVQV